MSDIKFGPEHDIDDLLSGTWQPPRTDTPKDSRVRCDNCGAMVPASRMGTDPRERRVCCIHCVFNPEGCRCRFGEYGVAQDGDY